MYPYGPIRGAYINRSRRKKVEWRADVPQKRENEKKKKKHRESILQDKDGRCFLCMMCPKHHVNGPAAVHNNRENDLIVKRYAQAVWEQEHTRAEFQKKFRMSYLQVPGFGTDYISQNIKGTGNGTRKGEDMGLRETVYIIKHIDSDRFTDEEKGMAIYTIKNMETMNSITKRDLSRVVSYLFGLAFEMEIEGELISSRRDMKNT